MTFAFYAVALCKQIGYHLTFVLFAILGSILAFAPIVGLMLKGAEWRERLEEEDEDGGEHEEEMMRGRDGLVDGKEEEKEGNGRGEYTDYVAKVG